MTTNETLEWHCLECDWVSKGELGRAQDWCDADQEAADHAYQTQHSSIHLRIARVVGESG